jgi:hypothetical protein
MSTVRSRTTSEAGRWAWWCTSFSPRVFLGVAAILAALAAPESIRADPPATGKPTYSVGDWWHFNGTPYRQDCAQWVVVQADPSGSLIEECDGHQSHRDYANGLELSKVDRAGEDLVAFEPALPDLSFPLEVGKTWEVEYEGYTADDGARWTASASWHVAAFESVTVAAGTFDAYRIERSETLGRESYGIKLRSTGWWAPSAKGFVKFEHQDRRWNAELDSYGVAP